MISRQPSTWQSGWWNSHHRCRYTACSCMRFPFVTVLIDENIYVLYNIYTWRNVWFTILLPFSISLLKQLFYYAIYCCAILNWDLERSLYHPSCSPHHSAEHLWSSYVWGKLKPGKLCTLRRGWASVSQIRGKKVCFCICNCVLFLSFLSAPTPAVPAFL